MTGSTDENALVRNGNTRDDSGCLSCRSLRNLAEVKPLNLKERAVGLHELRRRIARELLGLVVRRNGYKKERVFLEFSSDWSLAHLTHRMSGIAFLTAQHLTAP